jgi:ACS family hexuronate transporter-like MFS transporter
MSTDRPLTAAAVNDVSPASRYRWWIVVLLFFSTTINYVDRALFSNLVPYFEADLKLGPMDLAAINVAFLLSYGLGMTLVGRFIDRVGVMVGFTVTFILWNVASVGHALVWSVGAFVLMRVLLGIGEAGNFPSAIRTVAEWFPKKERAYATGWFNSGANIGAVLTPLLVWLVADRWGWRACFATVGGVGIFWVFFWLKMYRHPAVHPRVSPSELAHIQSDPPDTVESVPVLTLLGKRQVYAYAMGRFFSEAPWWFYLFWMPKYLADTSNLTTLQRAWAVAFIYLVGDVGSIVGGWLSSALIHRGWSLNAARKTALLISAVSVLPVSFLALIDGPTAFGINTLWFVLPAVAVAAAAHQAWSANMYTIISDTLPKPAVGMTVGIGTAFGAVGSSIFQVGVALWLAAHAGNYALPFFLAGILYLVGLSFVHGILPRLEPATIVEGERPKVRTWQVVAAVAVLVAALIALQIYLNKPPFKDADDYYAKQAIKLNATATQGPTAKVGWQDARWTRWTFADGTTRWELVKLDRHGRPTIEGKGVNAKNYVGPTRAELDGAPSPATTQSTLAP